MKYVIHYDSQAESVSAVGTTAMSNSDIVVGKDGRILKARNGHRDAIAILKKIGRDIGK